MMEAIRLRTAAALAVGVVMATFAHRLLTEFLLGVALSSAMSEDGPTPGWVPVLVRITRVMSKPLDVLWRSSPDTTVRYGNIITWANSFIWAVGIAALVWGIWTWRARRGKPTGQK